jgi:hypothetical protein
MCLKNICCVSTTAEAVDTGSAKAEATLGKKTNIFLLKNKPSFQIFVKHLNFESIQTEYCN